MSKKKAKEATISHRKTMDRMLDRKLELPMAKVWEQEQKLMRAAIAKAMRGRSRADLTAADVRIVEKVVRAHCIRLSRTFSGYLTSSTRETQTEAIRSLGSFMGQLKSGITQLDRPAVVEKIVRAGQKELNTRRRAAAASIATNTYHAVRDNLSKFKIEDKKVKDLLDHVHEVADQQWWQVQRAMRTETSAAFNLAQSNAFGGLKEEFPGIRQRWTELINDLTGQPLDNRVAKDSIAMHGQVAYPGHYFTMPPGDVPHLMVGKQWLYPPNRPNDRAVLTPWMRGWGVPAWEYHGGVRIPLA